MIRTHAGDKDGNGGFHMRFGLRKPSPLKSLSARTGGARHARGQKGADPRLREERHGLAASEAETV